MKLGSVVVEAAKATIATASCMSWVAVVSSGRQMTWVCYARD